jgi:DGQHR domain-containing protein
MAYVEGSRRKDEATAVAVSLQDQPRVYVAVLDGYWLLDHTTPSWRHDDPHKGFQRIVREERARNIASTVLNQKRTFPNAIILATDVGEFASAPGGKIKIPAKTKFLVVDGQHRLWSQKFSDFEAPYACLLHMARTEKDMARLFLEINDTQKRVPSSLRWDLVRLVKPEGKEVEQRTADLIFELATEKRSPLFQRIDLTGEQPEIKLKQGSLAPEIKTLLNKDAKRDADFDEYSTLLTNFFSALELIDADAWRDGKSAFYKARVLRALIRVLSDIIGRTTSLSSLTSKALHTQLKKVDVTKLTPQELETMQGAKGVAAIYKRLHTQVFG